MKRKLIKQGLGGYTIYLPKKWIDLRNLQGGDEIDITEEDGNLIVASEKSGKKSEITVRVPAEFESLIIRRVSNPYKMGYDRIVIRYEEKDAFKTIKKLVNHYFVGFEIVSHSENGCILESITEPSMGNFHSILNKQFFILKEIVSNLKENIKKRDKEKFQDVNDLILNFYKHVNFLRRCISKKLFSAKLAPFYWELLVTLSLAIRKLKFLNNYASSKKIKVNKDIEILFKGLDEILEKVHKLYARKDFKLQHEIHNIEHKYAPKLGMKMINSKRANEKEVIFYLIGAIRMIYHASSPIGVIIIH